MAEQETDYIFTFGVGKDEYGDKAGHYVKIHGTYESAREEMVKRYGMKWAFQYEADEYFSFFEKNPWVLRETELKEQENEHTD